jgi:hypothetical protein
MTGGVLIRRSTIDRSAGTGLDTPGESRVPAAHLSLISAFSDPTGSRCHLTDAPRDDVPVGDGARRCVRTMSRRLTCSRHAVRHLTGLARAARITDAMMAAFATTCHRSAEARPHA